MAGSTPTNVMKRIQATNPRTVFTIIFLIKKNISIAPIIRIIPVTSRLGLLAIAPSASPLMSVVLSPRVFSASGGKSRNIRYQLCHNRLLNSFGIKLTTMSRFSEEQKRIAILLLHDPKTAEELNKQLGIPYTKLMAELKSMLKLEVITKEGYPTKYRLKENIANEVQRRKKVAEDDINELRLRAFIEMQAIEEDLLKKQMGKLKEALDKEKNFTIYSVEEEKPVKDEQYYSSYLDINFSVRDFPSLIRFMFFYGPSSIEVIKPAKVEFSAQDLQDGLVDLADMVQKYTAYITKIMGKEDIEKFHQNLYK